MRTTTTMHIHVQRPSAASTVALAAVLTTIALVGCAEWEMQTRAEAADRLMKDGQTIRALLTLAPVPWALPAAGVVAAVGHVASTVLRRGRRPNDSSSTAGTTDDGPHEPSD